MYVRRKRVALLIETSTTWGRGLIRGIARYAHEQAHWALTVEPRGTHERPTLPFNWRGDGVIGRFTCHEILDSILKEKIPAVNVSQVSLPDSPLPKVTTNECRVGEIAASHLHARNFRSLGYYGPPYRPHYKDRIFEAFQQQAKKHDLPLSVFQPDLYFKTSTSSHDDLNRLEPWLRQFKAPAGVLTWNAIGAFRVMSACEFLGIDVPTQIGVLAGENDELMESISGVSMSGIDHNPDEVGWQAAATLNQILRGDSNILNEKYIEPYGLRIGDSTAEASIGDEIVEKALALFRNNPKSELSIPDIAKRFGLSRRALEVRFNKALGRSPAAEIKKMRLAHAQELLSSTALPIGDIAIEVGFHSIDTFSRAFAGRFGITPRDYRKKHAPPTADSTSSTRAHRLMISNDLKTR